MNKIFILLFEKRYQFPVHNAIIQTTEKRQNSQGYIIRILQHFATKLRNITNFVMLFQAVMKFLSRLI
jgi:hypothetical protein